MALHGQAIKGSAGPKEAPRGAAKLTRRDFLNVAWGVTLGSIVIEATSILLDPIDLLNGLSAWAEMGRNVWKTTRAERAMVQRQEDELKKATDFLWGGEGGELIKVFNDAMKKQDFKHEATQVSQTIGFGGNPNYDGIRVIGLKDCTTKVLLFRHTKDSSLRPDMVKDGGTTVVWVQGVARADEPGTSDLKVMSMDASGNLKPIKSGSEDVVIGTVSTKDGAITLRVQLPNDNVTLEAAMPDFPDPTCALAPTAIPTASATATSTEMPPTPTPTLTPTAVPTRMPTSTLFVIPTQKRNSTRPPVTFFPSLTPTPIHITESSPTLVIVPSKTRTPIPPAPTRTPVPPESPYSTFDIRVIDGYPMIAAQITEIRGGVVYMAGVNTNAGRSLSWGGSCYRTFHLNIEGGGTTQETTPNGYQVGDRVRVLFNQDKNSIFCLQVSK